MTTKSRVSRDFLLNLLAALFLLITTEFIVLPQMANAMSSEQYGQVLMLLGIITSVSSAFGNGLNNVRLIMHHKYEARGINGDYNVLISYLGILALFVICCSSIIFDINKSEIIAMTILSLLGGLRLYLSVAFRLRINYLGIMLLNGIISVGYVIGLKLYILTDDIGLWWLLFLFGEALALGYLLYSTEILKEPFKRTYLFKETCMCFGWLCYLTLLGSLLNFMDRNIIYPILGGDSVAVLFVAMLTGKTVSYVAKPMGNVMLSYFAQSSFRMTRSIYWRINLATVIVGVILYFGSIAISRYVLHYFYPSYEELAMQLVMLATAIPLLIMIGALAQPAVLRFAKLPALAFWQSLYVVVYILGAIVMTKQYGLYGFCYVAILLAMLRIFILWWLGDRSVTNRR
ncbi:MAG: hypothetical protein J6H31_15115 [Butyrivibrio sp.]|nr:hypothetical protein [Butyrivibrio sp.]